MEVVQHLCCSQLVTVVHTVTALSVSNIIQHVYAKSQKQGGQFNLCKAVRGRMYLFVRIPLCEKVFVKMLKTLFSTYFNL